MTILKTPRNRQVRVLDVQEVFNIWKMLDNRYSVMNVLLTQKANIHDIDFAYIIDRNMRRIRKEIRLLEGEAEKYGIKGPRVNLEDFNLQGNAQLHRDKDIAWVYLSYLNSEILVLTKVLRDSLVDDRLKKIFLRVFKITIKNLFDYVDYLKIKGWIGIPPLYPYVPNNVDERISCNEVFFLWDHLVFRYENIHLTKILSRYVYDADLQVILHIGVNMLETQAENLENLLKHYGIMMPEAFSPIIPRPEATEIFEDRFIFFHIFSQMRNMGAIHAQAFAGSVLNKHVRKVFYDLLVDEVNITDKFLKYGKVKGWLPTVPNYRMI